MFFKSFFVHSTTFSLTFAPVIRDRELHHRLSFRKADAIHIMETKILRVVQQGETFAVPTQKAEGGQIWKSNIILQELGGKYENQYVGAMLGNLAQCRFQPGDVVAATLRFSTHQYEDKVFQDVLVTELLKVKG